MVKARASCEWCEHFDALTGQDLCWPCAQKWRASWDEVKDALNEGWADLFFRSIKTVGGNY
jgi:hypothetical protein